jgi:hypothetical protein
MKLKCPLLCLLAVTTVNLQAKRVVEELNIEDILVEAIFNIKICTFPL